MHSTRSHAPIRERQASFYSRHGGARYPNTQNALQNRWKLHDLRRKSNTDLRNGGAVPKERATLPGHRDSAINESHYEATSAHRERELIAETSTFRMTA